MVKPCQTTIEVRKLIMTPKQGAIDCARVDFDLQEIDLTNRPTILVECHLFCKASQRFEGKQHRYP